MSSFCHHHGREKKNKQLQCFKITWHVNQAQPWAMSLLFIIASWMLFSLHNGSPRYHMKPSSCFTYFYFINQLLRNFQRFLKLFSLPSILSNLRLDNGRVRRKNHHFFSSSSMFSPGESTLLKRRLSIFNNSSFPWCFHSLFLALQRDAFWRWGWRKRRKATMSGECVQKDDKSLYLISLKWEKRIILLFPPCFVRFC